MCIICQKEKRGRAKRDSKDRRHTEKLTTCTSLHGTLRNSATLRDDQRLLVYLVGGDDVAAEVKYHRSCYQRYTNRKDLVSSRTMKPSTWSGILELAAVASVLYQPVRVVYSKRFGLATQIHGCVYQP